jgi:hypothetical protein
MSRVIEEAEIAFDEWRNSGFVDKFYKSNLSEAEFIAMARVIFYSGFRAGITVSK